MAHLQNLNLHSSRFKLEHGVCLGLIANLAAFAYYLYSLSDVGYLPAPFMPNKFDNFMDLFNPLYWAFNDRRYTDWASVYPPLVFWFLRAIANLFNLTVIGEPNEPVYIREHSGLLIHCLIALYFLIPLVVLNSQLWKKISRKGKVIFYCLLVLSPPMLFSLDRGNLIVFAPLFISLLLAASGFRQLVLIGILINIKPYFAILLLVYIIGARWRELWAAILVSGIIFMTSGILLDESFMSMIGNIINFNGAVADVSVPDIVNFPSSISAFSFVLRVFEFRFLGELALFLGLIIDAAKYILICYTIYSMYANRHGCSEQELFACAIILIANSGTSVGGYSLILYYAIVPVLLCSASGRVMLTLMLTLYFPLDLVPLTSHVTGEQRLFFTDETATVTWNLGLGALIRPVVNFGILFIAIQFLNSRRSEALAIR